MKYSKNKTYFKGKTLNYSTEVIVNNKEKMIIWTVTIIALLCVLATYILTDSFITKFLITLAGIIVIVGTILIFIFSNEHEEEIKENEIKNTIDTDKFIDITNIK